MKRDLMIIAGILSAPLLTSCVTNDVSESTTAATTIGINMFKTAVDQKCRSELNQQSLYRAATMLMHEQQKRSLEDQICGCVSDKAPEQVTLSELGQATIDPSARVRIVSRVVTNTISACVTEFVQARQMPMQ